MENFIVSARKYRPATFDTVVGQQSITTTLKNAIRSQHIAQAFLFCGPRGVGKTTCARILAKTINCEKATEQIEACNSCPSCKSFDEGHSLNIYELDAASNNSVEDIRLLIDQVRIAPQIGTHKVYIIDEVHMLSAAAFNAFLKTLEEPPQHAIFILATTNKNKIIPTILSRCQIFDFKRIQVPDIAQHLQFIAKSEGIEADPDALHIIAQKADGALRDALSIFDRIVSFAGKEISYQTVIDNLNVLDYEYYFKTTDAILDHNIPDVLLILDDILNNGFDSHNFIVGLAEHLRNLLVSKDELTIQLLEVGDKIKERYLVQSRQCSPSFLLKALGIINQCDINFKESKNQRLLVELTLMQLCSIDAADENLEIKKPIIQAAKEKIHTKTSTPIATTTVAVKKVKEEVTPTSQASEPTPPAYKTKSLSINEMLKKSEDSTKKEKKEEPTAQQKESFTEEQLVEAWKQYATKVQEQGKKSFYTLLVNDVPVIKEDALIEYPIENNVQETIFFDEMEDIYQYLRKELKNDTLLIELVMKGKSTQRKPYTSREKYNRMVEKNPSLEKLRQQLDLEIEF